MKENIKKMKEIFFLNKKAIFIIAFFVVVGVFLIGDFAHANLGDKVAEIVSWLLHGIIYGLGWILSALMWALVWIAQWDRFIDSNAVTYGWSIVRDICNMFFILILLVIAFATILRVETYNLKKLLPKLIIMAILINFSKTICGLIIDFAQVIMLAFVNSFKDVGGANLTSMLGIDKLLSFSRGSEIKTNSWSVLGAYILALIYVLVSLVVVTVMLFVLVVRIVMLWIYIVLSPFAYLLASFPQGQKYASRWWSEFSRNVIIGPVLAFFLWLSFVSLGGVFTKSEMDAIKTGEGVFQDAPAGALTEAGSPEHMIGFCLSIAMLIGGLIVTQELGGAVGNIAGKGMGAINAGKAKALIPFRKGAERAARVGKAAGRLGVDTGRAGAGWIDRMLGRAVQPAVRKVPKVGAAAGEAIAKEGLVTAAARGVWRLPENIVSGIDKKVNQNRELRGARRNAADNTKEVDDLEKGGKVSGIMKYKNSDYALNKEEVYEKVVTDPVDGNIKEWTGEILKANDKEVRAMGAAGVAWHDSWRGSRSSAEAASNKAEEEAVDKEKQKMLDSNMSNEEVKRVLDDRTASQNKKMAASMILAVKKGFKGYKDIERARKMIGTNSVLKSKFDEETFAKQAHLAFDFNAKKADGSGDLVKQEAARKMFQAKIDAGAVDSTRLDAAAYKDKNITNSLKEYHGKDFGRVMETAFKRGKKYEDTVASGLLKTRDMDNLKEDKSAKTHAKLTGRVVEAFKDEETNYVDLDALMENVKNAKAKDINNIKVKELEEAIAANPSYDIKGNITGSMSYSKLKSMHRQGDNPQLVKYMKKLMTDPRYAHPDEDKISNDHELGTIV